MSEAYCEILRHHSRPLSPIATEVEEVLPPLEGIRAVLFDVYGTLVISGSGDVGAALPDTNDDAFRGALAALGIETDLSGDAGRERLAQTIRHDHELRRAEGVEFPEVEIDQIWRRTLTELESEGHVRGAVNLDYHRLAVEYEVRCNPVWPMPGVVECLESLRSAGLLLGIISNAQFFTPLLFPALLGKTAEDLALDAQMQYYSYWYGEAKPGLALYRLAERELAGRGISPREVLYVGNDRLNDIYPASQCGFRTALFAGDRRSLRLREDDLRLVDVSPDLVVTDLRSLIGCVRVGQEK